MKKCYLFFRLCLVIPVVLMVHQVQAQNTVTGTVTSLDEREPLPGVNVIVQGTSTGTTTDLDGTYRLDVPDEATLIFSYVGYLSQEIEVGNRSVINVSLDPDISQLEEIVVVGYGTQKKSDITGSVASIPEQRLNQVPNTNFAQAIQGSIPGVTITANSAGAEGNDVSIIIRGRNSINASNSPLIVLDGMPYSGNIA